MRTVGLTSRRSQPSHATYADRIVWQAASLTLSYPDTELVARAPQIQDAIGEAAPNSLPLFTGLLQCWRTHPLSVLQTGYVDTFDMSRKYALYLSYWTDGDTRRRGQVLTTFKQRYRSTGFLVNTRGELPDYLPLVLEYAAVADAPDGAELLQQYRSSLELLRLALTERDSPYAGVLTAVCDTLPGASPADRREVLARAQAGPPTESVGLDSYDPRLLPLSERS